MGMYTEFHFNVELKKGTPYSVIEILAYMVEGGGNPDDLLIPDHPLFTTSGSRWEYMLRCDSAYFPHESTARLYRKYYDDSLFLNVRCSFKNYSDEINMFVDWIAPYVNPTTNFLGFHRYEDTEKPTLLFLSDFIEIEEDN